MYKTYTIFVTLFLTACAISHDTALPAHKLTAIPLELTTHMGDKHKYFRGDEIQFLLSLGSNAYIYMFYIDAEKKILQILPSKNQSTNYYSSGYFLTLPEYKDGYRFIVSEPFGEEKIWLIASDQSIGIDVSDESIEEIKQKIKDYSKRGYGEYVFHILTMP